MDNREQVKRIAAGIIVVAAGLGLMAYGWWKRSNALYLGLIISLVGGRILYER